MPITVEELVAIPSLGTRVVAGSGGLGQSITWAHVCELSAPWEWLGAGVLLMSTGLGIPAGVAAQVHFLRHVAAAGMVGVAVGEGMSAPALEPEMLAEADGLKLPLLITRYEIPFVALAQTVAGANEDEERARLARTQRLYEQMRLLTADTQLPALLDALSAELDAALAVIDPRFGSVAGASKAFQLTDAMLTELGAVVASSRPAAIRLLSRDNTVALTLPAPRPAFLVASSRSAVPLDVGLLEHAAAVVAIQRAGAVASRERSRRLGASLLAQLLDNRADPVSVDEQLLERDLQGSPLAVSACLGNASDPDLSVIHHVLDDAGHGHLLLTRSGITYAMTRSGPALELLSAALPADGRIGVSEPFTHIGGVAEAHRQARWSLHVAGVRREQIARYGEDTGASVFLPHSLDESSDAAREVLGALFAYDKSHDSGLVNSLRVFLEENRSWQRASRRLIIHKQTLVYRMGRVEQITGLRLDHTADVTEMWLALQAATAAGLLDPAP